MARVADDPLKRFMWKSLMMGCSVTPPRRACRRPPLVDVLACPCGGLWVIVSDISEREVIVALLAYLGLPPFAPPVARAHRPAFELS